MPMTHAMTPHSSQIPSDLTSDFGRRLLHPRVVGTVVHDVSLIEYWSDSEPNSPCPSLPRLSQSIPIGLTYAT
jgi:hypothetical protein